MSIFFNALEVPPAVNDVFLKHRDANRTLFSSLGITEPSDVDTPNM